MILLNQKGTSSLDFIFALVLVSGMSMLMFALTLTLSVTEITQYITYASARAYLGAHNSEAEQRALAQEKFLEVQKSPPIRPLYERGWFKLGEVQIGDFSSEYPQAPADDADNMVGVRVKLTALLLDFRVPFFGSTVPEGNALSADVTSFLMREPTDQECRRFNEQRYGAILRLSNTYAQPNTSDEQKYAVVSDNGC